MTTNEAKETIVRYFRFAFEAAGVEWNADNTSEIKDAIEAIIRGAILQANDKP
jgi:hypothetical protein